MTRAGGWLVGWLVGWLEDTKTVIFEKWYPSQDTKFILFVIWYPNMRVFSVIQGTKCV